MQLYLSDKEVSALIDTSTEWCLMMCDGNDDSVNLAQERLDNGLGSALYKLYKDRNGQRAYQIYARKKNMKT